MSIPVAHVPPAITIDYEKCTTPFDCKKCLQICPIAVFRVNPTKEERGKENNKQEPGTYKLVAYYRDACTGCNKCLDVCPVSAIKIEWPGGKA